MLVQASCYYLTASKSKILTVGINLLTDTVDVELRSHNSKTGVLIPDFNVFQSKTDLIENYFESNLESADLYFSVTNNNETVYFAGRRRFKNKLLVIFTKDPERPRKLFLAKNTYYALRDIAPLIVNRRCALTRELKDVQRVAEMLTSSIKDMKISADDTIFPSSLLLIDPDLISLKHNMNLDATKIMYEILYFCPDVVKNYLARIQ